MDKVTKKEILDKLKSSSAKSGGESGGGGSGWGQFIQFLQTPMGKKLSDLAVSMIEKRLGGGSESKNMGQPMEPPVPPSESEEKGKGDRETEEKNQSSEGETEKNQSGKGKEEDFNIKIVMELLMNYLNQLDDEMTVAELRKAILENREEIEGIMEHMG